MRETGILLALLAGYCGCAPSSLNLPQLENESPGFALPGRGVVPCAHPAPRSVAFDETTVLGISAQEAVAHVEGRCTAPLTWASAADAEADETEVSVQIELDHDSATEVTYPVSDTCSNKITVEGDVTLSTADGKLSVRDRGVFAYTRPSSDLAPIESPAELSVSGAYVVRVGGVCAGEIAASSHAPVGSWSKSGCPLGESALERDSRPELAVRMAQLEMAWREAHLAAAWDSGDETELELDVQVRSAPLCENPYGVVSVPVNVRYGTRDGVVPVHEALGHASFSLLGDDLAVRLLVTEPTDCSEASCSELRLEVTYPNAPSQRLGRLISHAMTQQVLTFAGTPHAVECLLTFDCALDQICADGFCRAPPRTQTGRSCIFDADCSSGGHCRAGTCSAF